MKVFAVICALVFSASCGVTAPPLTADTYEQYLLASSQLTCEAGLRCCGTLCDPAADASFYQQSARTLHYLAEGLLRYDPRAAAACLAGLADRYAGCDASTVDKPVVAACAKVLIPQSPVGGQCEAGIAACVPGSICVNDRCVALGQLGQGCQPNGSLSCDAGLFCPIQFPYVCTTLFPVGQACPNGIGCAAGAYCTQMQTSYVCTAYARLGEPCSASKLCDPAASLLCLPAGTCQVQPVPRTIREQLCSLR